MSSNLWNWVQDTFLGTVHERELGDLETLYERAATVRDSGPLSNRDQVGAFLIDTIDAISERCGIIPSDPLAEALWSTIRALLTLEGFIVDLPEADFLPHLSMEESVALRTALSRHLRLLADHKRLLSIWKDTVVNVFADVLNYFPSAAFSDIGDNGVATNDSVVLPEAKAHELCDNAPEAIERSILPFFEITVADAGLFQSLRAALDHNAAVLSGATDGRARNMTLPTENKNKSPEYLVSTYLQGTPLQHFFTSPLPFAIPFTARFEHTHIVGGSGHGKTQLLQFLINHDLVRALDDSRSVVILDSQGDLIRTISHLAYFIPSAQRTLADRFVLIDPNDVEHPVCLNMFDFNRSRLSGYTPVDREKILNATVDLYEYFFGALLGAELTQRQGLIFKYLARLLMEIPNATIHTLRGLMEDGERFRPYMRTLTGTTKAFFETRFFDRQFNETKKQILTRLWGVLSNASLERMFSHPKNAIDLFDLLNDGKIVLINTAKDLLGQEGSAIFGRFFIAMIAQAAIQRAAVPAHERNPGFVYIDEAQDYFDDSISHLLNQARKYRIGLALAHQNLDQLTPALRASVLSSTTIKFAGGLSAKDAGTLDSEYRCSSDFLLAQRKGHNRTSFACFVKNFTTRALSVTVPLGLVESLSILTDADYEALLQDNRERYCESASSDTQATTETGPISATEPQTVPDLMPALANQPEREGLSKPGTRAPAGTKRSAIPGSGRGGQQHKYLQHLIKMLAEERGFRASVEETILDGAGRVDVSLVRDNRRIAFEISVTTTNDHELGNVEKCIASGYDEIVLVATNGRRISALKTFIENSLEESARVKVRYLAPEDLVAFFDAHNTADVETVVRGYKVKASERPVDQVDAAARRQAVADVVARSMRRSGG